MDKTELETLLNKVAGGEISAQEGLQNLETAINDLIAEEQSSAS